MATQTKEKKNNNNYAANIGDLYQFYALDCIVHCARWVSLDFNVRPKFYRSTLDSLARDIADLQAKWGSDTNFPDTEDRNFLFAALFGMPLSMMATDETIQSAVTAYEASGKSFTSSYRSVSERVRALIEYQLETNVFGLENAVRSHLIRFQSHLLDLEGSSLRTVYNRVSSLFNLCIGIVKDPSISGVFGVATPLSADWPLRDQQPEGARLVEEISRHYSPSTGNPIIPQDRFVQLQRISQFGRFSIVATVESNLDIIDIEAGPDAPRNSKDSVIQRIAALWYVWASELDEYQLQTREA